MKYLSFLFLSLFTISCSGGRVGYYVALWPPEESSLRPGDTAKVISQSDLRDVYVIENESDKSREEVPRPSGRLFRKASEARKFVEEFEPYKNLFAYSERSLIIRTAPDASSGREYRLRPSQVIKIIDRLPGPVEVNNLTGYWFHVLTDDGFDGYCFDRHLTVYEYDSAKSVTENEKGFIESFLGNTWYPTSYLEAISSKPFVIEKIETGEGIFPDPENNRVVVQTAEERLEYSYSGIIPSGKNSIYLSDTPLEIFFYSNDKIYIKYSHRGIDYSAFYTLLENPLDHYIDEEMERRKNVIGNFLSRGKYLTSALYGSIAFRDNGTFTWTGYINLVPEIIPFGYGNSGRIKIDYFLSDSLSTNYDGVFSFLFDRNSREIIFAYALTENGVHFTHIPSGYVDGGIVTSLPEEGFVYYFRQSMLTDGSEG